MDYCFIREELDLLPEHDPLTLQAVYARALGQFLCWDPASGTAVDASGALRDVRGAQILLRCCCDHAQAAMAQLTNAGAILTETPESMARISRWENLGLTRREVRCIAPEDLSPGSPRFPKDLIREDCCFFLKSREKGFSAVCSGQRFLHQEETAIVLRELCRNHQELLISPYVPISRDSLGKKEARFFILDGDIANASRMLHSVKHAVPGSLLRAAREAVAAIAREPGFPKSYVLDMALFEETQGIFPDIVEVNPLTTAMCYINNSIFTRQLPAIAPIYPRLGAGGEYCYDALTSPERYVLNRRAGASYTYENPSHFVLL